MSTELGPATPERAQVVAARLTEVRHEISDRFLEMGELLLESYRGAFHRQLGFGTFEDFVQARLDMSVRRAHYLMEVFDVFILKLNMPRDTVAAVGWTRLKEIAPVVNADNVAQWTQYAATHTTGETNLAVRQAQAPPDQRAELRQHSGFTVLVFDDEREVIEGAINLAKLEAASDRPGRALFLICQDYASEASARQMEAMRARGVVPAEDSSEEAH